jgi:glutamate synthase domain-containing protein 3
LIAMHREESGSGLAAAMLADWPRSAEAFVRLTPKPQA